MVKRLQSGFQLGADDNHKYDSDWAAESDHKETVTYILSAAVANNFIDNNSR